MNKFLYSQMIHAQENAHSNAWAYILQSWHTPTWKSIPQNVRLTLGLSVSLGMYNGMLVTQAGAQGITLCIANMNRPRKA